MGEDILSFDTSQNLLPVKRVEISKRLGLGGILRDVLQGDGTLEEGTQ